MATKASDQDRADASVAVNRIILNARKSMKETEVRRIVEQALNRARRVSGGGT